MRRADAGHVRKNVAGTGRGGLDRMLGCPEPTVPGLDQRMRERALRREGITGRETAVLCRARDSKEKRGRPAQSRYMPLAAAPYFGEGVEERAAGSVLGVADGYAAGCRWTGDRLEVRRSLPAD